MRWHDNIRNCLSSSKDNNKYADNNYVSQQNMQQITICII